MYKAEMQELFAKQKEGVRMAQDKGCYGCEDRHYLCHSTCDRHKRAKEKHDAEQAVIKAERAKLNDVDGLFADAAFKAIKRRRDR
jgi:hypothetical protein